MTIEQKRTLLKGYCDCDSAENCYNGTCPLLDVDDCDRYENDDVVAKNFDLLFNPIFKNGRKNDVVNHPNHYTAGKIECIEAIQESMSFDEYIGFLKGQIIKYIWRYRLKDKPEEDLRKCLFYLERLMLVVEEKSGRHG